MNISTTADQALRVLIELGSTPNQSPAELARALDLNRTAVHRLLATLHARGFVRRVGGTAIYSLGPTVLRLADSVEPDVQQVARPILERLSEQTSETVLLFVPDLAGPEPHAVAVDQVETHAHVLRVQFDIGHRIPLHQGAAALSILAASADDVVETSLSFAPDPDAVRSALSTARRCGYSSTHDELLPGVAGVAAPITNERGAPLGSISIAVPTSRAGQLASWTGDLVAAAAEVAAMLETGGGRTGVEGENPASE
ncbi:IclR family transcriptional regulator [Gordonia terrae]|uniref:IclR family transcriptional regulator n=2 Tax=Gordonia terrae TaxID=2055 RepID=A0AAD0K5T7_9ACTN|nr:IclR family transcriptional regulator [Gordonia terrae]VTR06832.1 IclR family transcriptional regulator [Clostridioides difficile]ANY22530.1 hypothetical protein BCM27_06695 [Gordonia terrae]AWO83266.1 IclR family transcriptional regulator [Gordonia terrae]VTS36588.1 Acetate operon repressor [Gordonia terrae]GAB43388.1 putative transcriptional regulator [Gordonia terrae NBRC 100016]